MKAILLPTDFSENSVNAIHYAVKLFTRENCEFYILNIQMASSFVSDNFMTMSSSATIYNTIIDTSKKSLQNLITTIQKKHKNEKHSFQSIVDYDNFIDAINQISGKKDIDLIVMGTKGATGAVKVFFGSNAARVMQRCNAPVLVIPNDCKFSKIDKIAFTSNYSTHYNREELEPLIEIARNNNAKIHVLHLTTNSGLSENQENNKNFLDTVFDNINHEFVNLDSANVFMTIQDYINNNDIKLLAMMGRKHSLLERLFARHLVETFAFKIDLPFLVMGNTGRQY